MDEKYKEALNHAWSLREDGYKNKDVQETVEYIFPQLKQEQTEELSTSLNGLMQEYVKSGKDEEEQEHRLKCYQLFWDALGDSEFFKQKEHKPVVTHGETYHVDTLGTQQVIAGKMPQKPTEWSEEDEKIRQSIIKDIEFERNFTLATTDKVIGDKVIGKYNEQINWLKSIPLNLKKKNEDVAKLCSNEWSKEDERKLQKCIKIVERWEEDYDIAYAPYSNMLKSLCPQSKVEWSEEDEKILHSIKQCVYDNVANIGTVDKNRFIDWLESLSPSWKPSKEQIMALRYYLNHIPYSLHKEHLSSLRDDCEKLFIQ